MIITRECYICGTGINEKTGICESCEMKQNRKYHKCDPESAVKEIDDDKRRPIYYNKYKEDESEPNWLMEVNGDDDYYVMFCPYCGAHIENWIPFEELEFVMK